VVSSGRIACVARAKLIFVSELCVYAMTHEAAMSYDSVKGLVGTYVVRDPVCIVYESFGKYRY